MAKRIALSFFSVLLIATMLLGFMPAQPVRAGTETYNHIIPFTITDTSGVARTQLPVIITYDVNGRLVAYGLVNATATDTYVDSSGASNSPVGSGTAYDYLMATDNITVVIPSLPAYGSYTINLYTGYAPVQTIFPVITGEGGYLTTVDDADIELSDNFTIEQKGWVTTTFTDNYSNRNLVYKEDAFITYVSGAENITSIIISSIGTETLRPDGVGDETNLTGSTGATHWGEVNDANDATYAFTTGAAYLRDLYTLDDTTPLSVGIEQITVYFRIQHSTGGGTAFATPEIKIDGTVYTGAQQTTVAIATKNQVYTTSPATGELWTADEINNMQLGISIKANNNDGRAADIWAVVSYAPAVTATEVSSGEHKVETTQRAVLDYNDTTTKVNCASPAVLDDITNLTLIAWIYPDGWGEANAAQMFTKSDAATYGWHFTLNQGTTGLQFYRFFDDTNGFWTTANCISLDTWQHIAMTYNSSDNANDPVIYVDGVSKAITEGGTPLGVAVGDAAGNLFLGNNAVGSRTHDGMICEVSIFNQILTSTEILAHRNGTYDGTGLVGYWKLDEGVSNVAYDESGEGNNGTITAPVWGSKTLRMYVDDTLRDMDILASVSDNESNWLWIQNNVMPYMDYATIDLDGVEVLRYEPTGLISGTTLPDVTGTNDAVITWGTNTDLTITGGDIMDSNSATSVGTTSAQMQGNLFYIGTYAAVYLSFEYGLDATYGYFTSETSAAAEQTFAITLTGLTPNTTYHFRAIARSGVVYSYGEDTTFTTAYSTVSQGSTTPLIISIGAFSGYQETGDLLFTAEIVLTYPPYYPTETAYHYFQIQLLDTDGTTILGASPISQWGDRPSSIYFNPTVVASALTYGDNYTIRITNVSSDNLTITTAEDLEPTDWRGDNLNELDEWCIGVATSMQNTDGTILTDPYLKSDPTYGVIITSTPGGFFVKGIPNIASIRPNLFTTGEHKASIPSVSSTVGYNVGTTLTDRVGATIVTDAQTVADVFNLTGQMFLLYMIFGVVLFCVLYTVSKTQGFGALGALCLSLPIMGASIYFNITDVQLFVLGGIICAILFVRQFILKTL